MSTEIEKLADAIDKLSRKIDSADFGGGGYSDSKEARRTKSTGFKEDYDTKGMGELGNEARRVRLQLDDVRSSLSSFTGLANSSVPTLMKHVAAARGLGIEYRESARNLEQLIENMPSFLDKSEEIQNSISMQSARLSKLGVDYGTNAKNMVFLRRSLGMADKDVLKFNETLFNFSKALKQPPQVIFKDFAAAMPKLAQFGKDAPRVFMETATVAKKLDIDLNQLLGTVDKFDTFESAAEAAGNFNNIMGEQLISAEELAMTDPAEKAELLTKRLREYQEKTGKSFMDLNYRAKKLASDALGFDVATMETFANASLEDSKKVFKQKDTIKKTSEEAAEGLAKAAARTVTTMDRLAATKDQLGMLTQPFLKLEDQVQNNINQLTLFTKISLNAIRQNAGLSKAFSAELSKTVANQMIKTSDVGDLKEGMIRNLKSVIPVEKFQEIVDFLDKGFQDIYEGKEQGVKSILDKTFDGESLMKLSGISAEDLIAYQKTADRARKQSLDVNRGIAEYVGFTPKQADELAKKINQGRVIRGEAAVASFDATIKTLDAGREEFAKSLDALEKKDPSATLEQNLSEILTKGGDAAIAASKMLKAQLGQDFGPESPFIKSLAAVSGQSGEAVTTLINSYVPDDVKEVAIETAEKLGGMVAPMIPAAQDLIDQLNALAGNAPAGAGMLTSPLTLAATGAKTAILDAIAILEPAFATLAGSSLNAGGFSGLGASLGDVGSSFSEFTKFGTPDLARAAELSKVGVSDMSDALGEIPNIKTNSEVKQYIDGMNTSMSTMLGNIDKIAPAIQRLKFDETQAANIKILADALNQYAGALTKIEQKKDTQDKLIKAMEAIGSAFASGKFELTLDANKIGEAMGDKVAKAVKEVAKKG